MPSPSPNTWRATRRASSTRSPSRALALRWSACCMTSGCARRSRPGASPAPTERVGKVKVLSFTKHAPRDARAKKPEHFSVVVVGGGQAGLSMSYLLKHNGISHVVLEGQRIASAWRSERWDAFCLVTPNWQCRLPGHAYTGDDPQGFMGKDEIVAY